MDISKLRPSTNIEDRRNESKAEQLRKHHEGYVSHTETMPYREHQTRKVDPEEAIRKTGKR